MKKKIIAVIVALGIVVAGYFTTKPEQVNVGADLVSPIAGQTYTLAGSGMSSSDTSFTLSSFTITQNGYPIQDSDMSETFYITLEPGSRARQEIISCTTVGPNTGGQVLISGCVRGLAPITPYTASTSLAFAHSGGSTVIFSDPPQLFNQATFKANDETITGNWLIGTPLTSESIANKAYVDAVVSGTTTLSNDRLVVAGTAGETLATSTLVYFNPGTQRWNGVSSASSTTFDDRFIGLTQGSGTNGTAITNGILLKGRHTLSTGLTPGALYYAGTATGTISVSTSSQTLGVAVSATVMYFDPIWIDVPTENGDNTFTGTNIFTGNVFGVGSASTSIFTASTTYTKSSNLRYVIVEVQAAGGNGASALTASQKSAGGGGGGYCRRIIPASSLSATTSVTVGAVNASSSFGSFCISQPGTSPSADATFGGAGGTASGGDVNIAGQRGEDGDGTAATGRSGNGGSSILGKGGVGRAPGFAGESGQSYGGGGAGGSANDGTDRAGGTGGSAVIIITEVF